MRTSVKGVLHDTAGRPVKEAVVMIVDGSSEFNDIASVTDDSGVFYLSNIAVPGRYVLQIQGANGSKTTEVHLQNNEPIEVTW